MKGSLSYKIFAVLASILIWLQTNLLREQTTVLNIPLAITGTPDNMYVYQTPNLKIPIAVTGRGLNILMYYLSDQSIIYKGEEISLEKNILDFNKIDQALPDLPNLKFQSIRSDLPKEITTDIITSKKVPVIYDFVSLNDKETLLKADYEFNELVVSISGPSKVIQSINSVFTEKIRADILKTKKKNVYLISSNEHVVIVPTIIELNKKMDVVFTKTLTFLPINYDETLYVIFPQNVTLIIEGKADSLAQVENKDIIPFIDIASVNSNENIPIYFHKPDFIRIVDFTPKFVRMERK